MKDFKPLIFVLLFMFLFTCLVGCSESKHEYPEISHVVKNELPNFHLLSDMEKAKALMELVYFKVPLKPAIPGTDYINKKSLIYEAFYDDKIGYVCGGLAVIYASIATEMGLEVRQVSLFDTIDPITNSHATVETKINGKWIATDPTFNVMFKNNSGDYIGYIEMARDGFITEQLTPIDGRALDQYYMPLSELLNFTAVNDGDNSDLYPAAWNGNYIINEKNYNIIGYNKLVWDTM